MPLNSCYCLDVNLSWSRFSWHPDQQKFNLHRLNGDREPNWDGHRLRATVCLRTHIQTDVQKHTRTKEERLAWTEAANAPLRNLQHKRRERCIHIKAHMDTNMHTSCFLKACSVPVWHAQLSFKSVCKWKQIIKVTIYGGRKVLYLMLETVMTQRSVVRKSVIDCGRK